MSVNIQTSSGLVKIAGTPTIDTDLSNVSKNPVQNKVVTEKFDEINNNLSQLSYNENSINGNIVNGTNLIGTAVREGSFALSDSVVIPSGSNTISTVYFTDGTKSTLNFSFSDGSVALPNPTTSDFTVSHVYFNSVHVGKIIKNIQLEIGTTSKGELYYVSSNNKLTKEIHKLNDSLDELSFGENSGTVNILKDKYKNSALYTNASQYKAYVKLDIKGITKIYATVKLKGSELSTYNCDIGTGIEISYNRFLNYGNIYIIEYTFSSNDDVYLRISSSDGVDVNTFFANYEVILSDKPITSETVYKPYVSSAKMLTEDVETIKSDLGGLSFSVSGTTLSITDGTNTWSLSAN